MPVSVSLINMKGGVGKTTLAFNLAWFASAKKRRRVLVVDLDPQANASQYLMGVRQYLRHIRQNYGTIVSIFEQFTPAFANSSAPSPLTPDSVITNIRSGTYGGKIDLILSRLELAWTLKNPTSKDHLLANF
jgi:chromosome partitioning protein